MSRRLALLARRLAGRSAARAVACPAATAGASAGAVPAVPARQRAERHPASGQDRACRDGEHLVPRRFGEREARAHRLRALFEHLMFEGSKNVKKGSSTRCSRAPARTTTARPTTTGPTTSSTCRRTRWSWRCSSSRIAWRICSTRCRPSRSTASATSSRTSGARATRTGRTAWRRIEIDKMLWPANHPYNWPMIGYMEDLTAASSRRRRGVLQEVLRAQQREPGHRRRHRLRQDARAGREVVQRRARAAQRSSRSHRRRPVLTPVKRQTLTDRVSLPRLYLAWLTPATLCARRCRAGCGVSVLTGGKNSRLVQATGLRRRRSRRTSRRSRAPAHSAARSRSSPPPGPVTPSPNCRRRSTKSSRGCARRRLTAREVQRAINQIEASFYRRMERVEQQGRPAERVSTSRAGRRTSSPRTWRATRR